MGFKILPIHKIHNSTTYKMYELATVLNVCPATIWNYVQRGMPVINRDSKPWYFDGKAVKEYLIELREAQKMPMSDHECFCMKCQKPVDVKAESIKLFSVGLLTKDNFNRSIKIEAECFHCGTTVSRFTTDGLLFGFLDYYMIRDIEIIETKKQTTTRRKRISDPAKRDSE